MKSILRLFSLTIFLVGYAYAEDKLLSPSEITLKGAIRVEELNTPLGKVNLRWPRSIESLFGRTPSRAMVDAATTVSKALKSSVFPKELQAISQEWQVIFIGGELKSSEIPMHLISNCHPGWMTPPANIYIVGERVAAGCGDSKKSTSVADADLTEVLVHELGHAIEFILLANSFGSDRMRAEGFATWFETYASSYSTYINQRELRRRNAGLVEYSLKNSPGVFTFQGSGTDYARASFYFGAVENRFGLSGIMRLYQSIKTTNGLLLPAISKEFRWDQKALDKEVEALVVKYR